MFYLLFPLNVHHMCVTAESLVFTNPKKKYTVLSTFYFFNLNCTPTSLFQLIEFTQTHGIRAQNYHKSRHFYLG